MAEMCCTMSSWRRIICHPACSSAAAGRGDSALPATTQPACCGAGGKVLLCNLEIRTLFKPPTLVPKEQSPSRAIWGQADSLGCGEGSREAQAGELGTKLSSAPRLDFSGNPDYRHLISPCSSFLHAVSTWAHLTSARRQAAVVRGFDEAGRKNHRDKRFPPLLPPRFPFHPTNIRPETGTASLQNRELQGHCPKVPQ